MDANNLTTISNTASQQVLSVAKKLDKANVGLRSVEIGTKESASSGKELPPLEASEHLSSLKNPQKESSAAQPGVEELRELVAIANEAPVVRSSQLKFSVEDGTDINVVRVEDSETGELIRQVPTEQMVALAKALEEQKQGAMLEEKA